MKFVTKSLHMYLYGLLGNDIFSILAQDLKTFSGDLRGHIYNKFDLDNVSAVKNGWVKKEDLIKSLTIIDFMSMDYMSWQEYITSWNVKFALYLKAIRDKVIDQYNLYLVVRSGDSMEGVMFEFEDETRISFTKLGWASFVSSALDNGYHPSNYYAGNFVSKEIERDEVFKG